MKTIKVSLLFLIFSMVSVAVFAQNTEKEIHQKLDKTLNQLSKDQLAKVLGFANFLSMGNEDMKKADDQPKQFITKVLKSLPIVEQQQLLDFAIMEKYGLNDKKIADQPKKNIPKKLPPPLKSTAKAAAPVTPVGPTTTIEFAEKEFDFGVIESGEKVSYVYKFTNTGTEPLIIKDAKGSCGCTVPKWPREPLAPGETAEMLVEFNSKGKSGAQNKRVTITANTTPAQTFINIKGEVLKKQ